MNIGSSLLSTTIVILIGFVVSILYIYLFKKDLFGGKKVGIFVGVMGSIIGGFLIDCLFQLSFLHSLYYVPYIKNLLVNKVDVNFIASFLGVWFFLELYNYVSKYTERS